MKKKEINERPVGEKFKIFGKSLTVQKSEHGCEGCFYFGYDCSLKSISKRLGACFDRTDGEKVIFKQ